jgi:membrane AbrB-like protein
LKHGRLVLTLAIGTLGGAVFAWLSLPLPWMLGAMTLVMLASVGGARVSLPRPLRDSMIAVLGVLLGSSFTPELLASIGQWRWTMMGQLVSTGLMAAIGYLYGRHVIRLDKPTALFAGAPGGQVEMITLGEQAGGDARVIALFQTIRIMTVVFTVPIWFRSGGSFDGGASPPWIGFADLRLADLAILALCAIVGPFVGARLRLPAGMLIGPMLLSAIAHLTGLTQSAPPTLLVIAAQIAIGSANGARFDGVPLSRVATALAQAVPMALLMVGGAVLVAFATAHGTGLPAAQLVLTYAPGGIAEMNLIALVLGLEVAFVATHHIARVLLVLILVPIIARIALRR